MLFTVAWTLMAMIFAVYLLSIITDEFFVESLDAISNVLKLPSNVAGASLMAMGSSAPELAIALIALFQVGENSDMGIGTIVGSAIFNILVITGVSAIARPAKISLTVVTRDTVAYLISIGLLFFTFWDGEIFIYEAIIFLVFYAVYIVVLFQWNNYFPEEEEEHEEEEDGPAGEGLYHTVTGVISTGMGLMTGDAKKSYVRAFIVSVAIIAFLSWVLVESAIHFAEALAIPPVLVALTLLAGGTSVPDMIASVVVAKQGRGDMAVANAVGSNIFDILIGLGLPWLIGITLLGKGTILVGTGSLLSSAVLLLATVFILYIFLYTGRELSRTEGYILVGLYVVYVLYMWLVGIG